MRSRPGDAAAAAAPAPAQDNTKEWISELVQKQNQAAEDSARGAGSGSGFWPQGDAEAAALAPATRRFALAPNAKLGEPKQVYEKGQRGSRKGVNYGDRAEYYAQKKRARALSKRG